MLLADFLSEDYRNDSITKASNQNLAALRRRDETGAAPRSSDNPIETATFSTQPDDRHERTSLPVHKD